MCNLFVSLHLQNQPNPLKWVLYGARFSWNNSLQLPHFIMLFWRITACFQYRISIIHLHDGPFA
jgi:hypothetical protein